MMNLLIIAYGCEPNKGSEQGVGWNWSLLFSHYQNVHVITRKNNETEIKQYIQKNQDFISNIKFSYYDLPKLLLRVKSKNKRVRLYYLLWSYFVIRFVKLKIDINKYDKIIDFKFGNLFYPSFVYKLKKPFIIGPCGAANLSYDKKYNSMSIKRKFALQTKKLFQFISRYSYNYRKNVSKSDRIILHSQDCLRFIPDRQQKKCRVVLHNGIEEYEVSQYKKSDSFRFIYAGRLIALKNIDIVIKAFIEASKFMPNAELYIVGSGNEEKKLKRMAQGFKEIIFLGKLKQEELFIEFLQSKVFVSMSESEIAPTSYMEAMYFGNVIISMHIPGVLNILARENAILISQNSRQHLIKELAIKMKDIYFDNGKYQRLKENTIKTAKEKFLWKNKIHIIEKLIGD